jgi:hypothetical protein
MFGLQGARPQFIRPDRKIRETLAYVPFPAVEKDLTLAVGDEAVR